MNSDLKISGVCRIRNNKVFLNGQLLYNDENAAGAGAFFINAYRYFKVGYAKFFKMDNLSKLGFLASEILIGKGGFTSAPPSETGIIIANSSSSLDTDFTYNDTIKDSENFFPSPAVFVYTLPNILIGEICIRHKITGESCFFISEKFDPDFIYDNVSGLFALNKVQNCIAGWVELPGDNYDAILFFIEKVTAGKNENATFAPKNILQSYLD